MLRTSLCTVSKQSARAVAAAPSSIVELLRLQQIGLVQFLDQVIDVPVIVPVIFGSRRKLWSSAVAVLRQGTLLLVLLDGISGHYFLSPFLTVPLAEVTRRSWRLLDDFTVFSVVVMARNTWLQWIQILHQLVDGFGRISGFST